MKRAFLVLAVLQAWCVPVAAEQQAAVPPLQRPDVIAVISLYKSVEISIAAGRLRDESRTVNGCNTLPEDRTIFTDATGVVRKYIWHGGSDDSVFTIRHFYDGAGRMRFVFISAGAVNETQMTHLIYFDEAGKRIHEIREVTGGPGYPFPRFSDEENLLQRDPRLAYAEDCPRK